MCFLAAGHVGFLAQKGPSARKAKSDLMNAIRSRSIMSERFPFLAAEFIPLKMSVEKYYLVFYQLKDQTAFVDCRQDYGWLLR